MLHATNIVLHFSSTSHESALIKLTELIDGIIAQFEEKQLYLVISLIKEHIDSGIRNSLIQQLILYAMLNRGNAKISVSEHIRSAISRFSESEESFIVKNLKTQYIGYCSNKLSDIISKITLYELNGTALAF